VGEPRGDLKVAATGEASAPSGRAIVIAEREHARAGKERGMNPRIGQLESAIARRNERLQEIKERLHDLRPARAKTDEPIQAEDYTGSVGQGKLHELRELEAEKTHLQTEVRQLEQELMGLTRPAGQVGG
jgi:chromosome segregation ATPase